MSARPLAWWRPSLAAVIGAVVGASGPGSAAEPSGLEALLHIEWRLGPDYPMGIQDSAVGVLDGKVVSAGGFTRHPLNILTAHPGAFGGQPSGFTKLTFASDPQNEAAGWQRIADMPGQARQGPAVAVVDDVLYAMGGMSYTPPYTYRDAYRLGGIYAPLSPGDGAHYFNGVDSWAFDPATKAWSRLADLPHGCNRRALTFCGSLHRAGGRLQVRPDVVPRRIPCGGLHGRRESSGVEGVLRGHRARLRYGHPSAGYG